MDFFAKIAVELNITPQQVMQTVKLLDDGATVPFIARYRKEVTGSLDEVIIMRIRDRFSQLRELAKRKDSVKSSIEEQDKMTPELLAQIESAETMTELEDIYLPYRPKRKTRASVAKEKGLEPLAKVIMKQDNIDIEKIASKYINPSKGLDNIEQTLQGSRDIIAEWISENKIARERLRNIFDNEAKIFAHIIKGKENEGEKFKSYFEFEEFIKSSPSHRILAILRGEKEGFLKVGIEPEIEKPITSLEKIFIKNNNDASEHVSIALFDSYKRLLQPSIETEIRNKYKEKADDEAIKVFAENLKQLLMAPPLHGKNVLAIDPGFRTGCKLVCLDKTGKLLHNTTIYPHPPENKVKEAASKIETLVEQFKIDAIAIGNGTAGRETETFIKRLRFKKDIIAISVNESGASVYSASDVAREEFPDYDVTVRGAVSIGRRMIDPLAELVKIDPKSIGVGQYQHDVNQVKLQSSLEDVVISCVNKVGVDLNTASKELLTYISGVGKLLAKNIVSFRDSNGSFTTRQQLKKIPRFGDKAFEQAAGFLRIPNGENLLDNTAVHPESYQVVVKMASDSKCTVEELINNKDKRAGIDIKQYVNNKTGMPTLIDIMDELEKPGRDPRAKFDVFEFDNTVHSIEDLKTGMQLPGIVTNITAFGAFVDIGVHQDGLIHVSQMSDKFIKDPNEIVKINQKVMVSIIDIDIARKRISLSLKMI